MLHLGSLNTVTSGGSRASEELLLWANGAGNTECCCSSAASVHHADVSELSAALDEIINAGENVSFIITIDHLYVFNFGCLLWVDTRQQTSAQSHQRIFHLYSSTVCGSVLGGS